VPLQWLKMLEAKLNPEIDTEVEHLKALVNVKKTSTEQDMVLPPPILSKELSEDDIQKLIENITK
jgi:hypothetical protein